MTTPALPPRTRAATGPVLTTALVLAVGATALAATATQHLSNTQSTKSAGVTSTDTARAAVLTAARQIAVDFAAYDYRHLPEDFKRVADESTGTFHQQYLTQSTGVAGIIRKARAVSTAQVADAGVVDLTGDSATVVVALNRTVRNTTIPQGRTDAIGIEMALVRRAGRWLASEVKPL